MVKEGMLFSGAMTIMTCAKPAAGHIIRFVGNRSKLIFASRENA
jgi:hypothetical protein